MWNMLVQILFSLYNHPAALRSILLQAVRCNAIICTNSVLLGQEFMNTQRPSALIAPHSCRVYGKSLASFITVLFVRKMQFIQPTPFHFIFYYLYFFFLRQSQSSPCMCKSLRTQGHSGGVLVYSLLVLHIKVNQRGAAGAPPLPAV